MKPKLVSDTTFTKAELLKRNRQLIRAIDKARENIKNGRADNAEALLLIASADYQLKPQMKHNLY